MFLYFLASSFSSTTFLCNSVFYIFPFRPSPREEPATTAFRPSISTFSAQPAAGTVLAVGDQDNYCYHLGFGKYVAVEDSAQGLVLWYAHLGTIAVAPGKNIAKGAEVGTVGATGYEVGVHLHFSLFDENGFSMQNRNGCGPDPTGRDIDPVPFLEKAQG